MHGRRGKDIRGYWRLYLPTYFKSNRDGRVKEHVYFFQEYYKCCLLPWAHVHHKDKNRENNMPWNLQGMMKKQHYKLHKKDRSWEGKDMTHRRCSICGSDKTRIKSGKYIE